MREEFSMNRDWKFRKNSDIEKVLVEDYFGSFTSNTKVGMVSGARGDGFFDADWKTVQLPHDWSLEDDFVEKNAVSGNKPQETAWYRKSFEVPADWDGKRVILKFDGIAIVSTVYLNNIIISRSTGGYTPITVEVTDFLRYGGCNCLAVEVKNTPQEGWWYEGGGIYRNVSMIVTEPVAFTEEGIFVSTEKTEGNTWKVKVRSEILTENLHPHRQYDVSLVYGKKRYTASVTSDRVEQEFTVENPPIWDIDSPVLSELKAELYGGGVLLDEKTVSFGFRTVTFSSKEGCILNGRPMKLKGVCLHHDHAGVGTAIPYAVHLYRMKLLKSMGCNAIRTSHNPQSPEFYRACNEVGIVVMNEVRHFSSTEECLHQLREFVRRDRNHPCVIMWSLFNEEPLQCSKPGEKMARSMKKVVTAEDGTRPLTGGMNGPLEAEGVVNVVDIMGFNYLQYGYDEFHANYPDMPIVGSENGSYITTRGEAVTDVDQGHFSAYGKVLWENLLPWSDTPGGTWKYISARPYVLGGFYWTGFDYRGEAGKWPSVTCKFGAMDMCGFPKENYYWHRSLWREEPTLFIAPHWSFAEGETAEIRCYSSCPIIALFVNGNQVTKWMQEPFDPVPQKLSFTPGVLSAIGYDTEGRELCRAEIRTAGKAVGLKTELSATAMKADGKDAVLLNVYAVDEQGTVVPDFDGLVKFELSGAGKLLGTGNGDNASHEDEKAPQRRMFHGMCQAVYQSTTDTGEMNIIVSCENLPPVTETVKVELAEGSRWIPSVDCRIAIGPWRMSDIYPDYPTVAEILNNLYTWIPTMVGYGKSLMMSRKEGFATISGRVTIPAEISARKAVLVMERMVGDFDLYLDEEKIYSSEGFVDRRYEIECPQIVPGKNSVVAMVFKLHGEDCGGYGNIYFRFD